MRTNVLICVPVPKELLPALDRMKTFPNVSTIDNLVPPHLTLAAWRIERLSEESLQSLAQELSCVPQTEFDLRFTGTEAFWNTALVVTTDAPEELRALKDAAVQVLRKAFWESFEFFDSDGFRPHVTVARIAENSVRTESPWLFEELPETVWHVDSFALWTKGEESEYAPVKTYRLRKADSVRSASRSISFARFTARTIAQISLFITCFLPLGTFLNDLLEHLLKRGPSVPGLVDATAFVTTAAATAAIWSTVKRKMNVRLAHAVTAFALACSVVLFASEIRELSVCMANESEEYVCFWIYEALIWSTSVMVGLLLLYFWIPNHGKR